MDAAARRAANLARYGDNNKKEAQGLRLIFRAIEEDGRLVCHKSFEKALADCCVFTPDAPALGIQLKTTGVNWVQSQTGNEYYSFRETDGYAGLLIVFVAVHAQPPRIWLAEGTRVVSKGVKIPVEFRRGMKSDRVREVNLATVADAIYTIYMAALPGSGDYVLRSPIEHKKPTHKNGLAEYDAFKRLQRSLPILFIDPPAEHMSYDYSVDGKRWQLKLAVYDNKRDAYQVACNKNAGIVDGKRSCRQYEVDDFDFLCIQLPDNTVNCCYVIPQGILAKLGVVGKATKTGGNIRVYPHRRLSWKLVNTDGVHWAESYRIDFVDDPLAQLACIVQRGGSDIE